MMSAFNIYTQLSVLGPFSIARLRFRNWTKLRIFPAAAWIGSERVSSRRKDSWIPWIRHYLARPNWRAYPKQRSARDRNLLYFWIFGVADGLSHCRRVNNSVSDRSGGFSRQLECGDKAFNKGLARARIGVLG